MDEWRDSGTFIVVGGDEFNAEAKSFDTVIKSRLLGNFVYNTYFSDGKMSAIKIGDGNSIGHFILATETTQ